MFKKTVSPIMLFLLVISTFTFAFDIKPAFAQAETIYINRDGSVEGTTQIQTADKVTYVFTSDIIGYITVLKDNIILDGNGHVLQGIQDLTSVGIDLSSRTNVTVRNILIEGFWAGIELGSSSGIVISDNTITNGAHGVYWLYFSSGNTFCRNNIINNGGFGLEIAGDNNTVYGNNFTSNYAGVTLGDSSGNFIYHNNFVANWQSPVIVWSGDQPNTWDNGYPSGGNYWSDYNGKDLNSGLYQNVTGSDGIGDTPYVIGANNTDHYPLTDPFGTNPLSVTISPSYALLDADQSQLFNSTAMGGTLPYMYQWCLNGSAVPSATFSSWAYSPTSHDSYTVYLNVTDSTGAIATSNTASPQTMPYNITFNQAGVGSDYTGTIVTIDGTNYTANDLPASFSWDYGSTHTFTYQSSFFAADHAEQYVWTGTSGLSSLQSDFINVTTGGIVIGNYKTVRGYAGMLNSMWVSPSAISFDENNASVGTLFNVTVWANMQNGTFDWQVVLRFNSSLFQEVNSWYSAGATSAYFAGHIDIADRPFVDNNAGIELLDETLLGNDYAPQTNACLCIVEFNITSMPTVTSGPFTGLFDVNAAGTRLDGTFFADINGNIINYASNLYDATYTLTHVNELVATITTNCTRVYQGQTVYVNVTVSNFEDSPENVWVTLYYNITAGKSIGAYPIYLDVDQSYTLLFTWNTEGIPCLNYTLTAVTTAQTGTNMFTDGNITIRLVGDVNGDGRVDLKDIALVARAFGSTPTSPNWNPAADINGDGTVNMKDITIVARNFGQHYP